VRERKADKKKKIEKEVARKVLKEERKKREENENLVFSIHRSMEELHNDWFSPWLNTHFIGCVRDASFSLTVLGDGLAKFKEASRS